MPKYKDKVVASKIVPKFSKQEADALSELVSLNMGFTHDVNKWIGTGHIISPVTHGKEVIMQKRGVLTRVPSLRFTLRLSERANSGTLPTYIVCRISGRYYEVYKNYELAVNDFVLVHGTIQNEVIRHKNKDVYRVNQNKLCVFVQELSPVSSNYAAALDLAKVKASEPNMATLLMEKAEKYTEAQVHELAETLKDMTTLKQEMRQKLDDLQKWLLS